MQEFNLETGMYSIASLFSTSGRSKGKPRSEGMDGQSESIKHRKADSYLETAALHSGWFKRKFL